MLLTVLYANQALFLIDKEFCEDIACELHDLTEFVESKRRRLFSAMMNFLSVSFVIITQRDLRKELNQSIN